MGSPTTIKSEQGLRPVQMPCLLCHLRNLVPLLQPNPSGNSHPRHLVIPFRRICRVAAFGAGQVLALVAADQPAAAAAHLPDGPGGTVQAFEGVGAYRPP